MNTKDEIQFITEEEFQAALKSRAAMNSVLNKVYFEVLEYMIRSVPVLLQKRMKEDIELLFATVRFLDQNKDLIPQREFLAVISNELRAKNPEWSIQELLEETGKEVRSRLKLTEEATKLEEDRLNN